MGVLGACLRTTALSLSLLLLIAECETGCFGADTLAAEPAAEDWVQRSNALARPALEVQAKYNPEGAGRLGLDGYDEDILDLRANVYERNREDVRRVVSQLQERLGTEKHPKVKQDLELLIQVLTDQLDRSERRHRLLLPYINVAELIFENTRALLDPNVNESRYAAAVVRLKKYAGLTSDQQQIVELAKDRIAERFEVPGLLGPYRGTVKKDLANSSRYVEGIKDLMRSRELEGWEEAHVAFANQVRSYNEWLEAEVLPRSRDDHKLPAALYMDSLQTFGVRTSALDLIEHAQFGYLETRSEMEAMAKRIAAERKWEKNGYRDVIRALKREQLASHDILPVYQQRLKNIEAIIRRERIVSLPARDCRIRFASAAESTRISAPSMDAPRLLGNTGEYGAFLIPLDNPNSETDGNMDDFLHDAIAWSLTAHEARPGHEMQYSAMIESGVSIPRAVFAWNSANTEGWGLYAEAIMQPHVPLEGQFFTLYMRLLRSARAFLDPMLNLGQLEPHQAKPS